MAYVKPKSSTMRFVQLINNTVVALYNSDGLRLLFRQLVPDREASCQASSVHRSSFNSNSNILISPRLKLPQGLAADCVFTTV